MSRFFLKNIGADFDLLGLIVHNVVQMCSLTLVQVCQHANIERQSPTDTPLPPWMKLLRASQALISTSDQVTSESWKQLGFQCSDPRKDVRTGRFALDQLHYLALMSK